MLRNILIIMLYLSLSPFYSCNKGNVKTVVRYYNNGKIMKEYDYMLINKDTLLNGKCKTYYTNGSIFWDEVYQNGKKSGIAKEYFENGNVKEVGKYYNGVKDSIWDLYNSNGRKIENTSWENGKQFGGQYVYFENGNLKKYKFYNLDGLKYILKFDSISNSFIEEGKFAFLYFDEDSIKLGNKLETMMHIAVVEDKSVSCNCYLFKDGNLIQTIKLQIDDFKNIYNMKVNCHDFTFQEKGRYNLQFDIQLFSALLNRTLSDHINLDIYVYWFN